MVLLFCFQHVTVIRLALRGKTVTRTQENACVRRVTLDTSVLGARPQDLLPETWAVQTVSSGYHRLRTYEG